MMRTVAVLALVALSVAYPHTMVNNLDWLKSDNAGIPKFTPTMVTSVAVIGDQMLVGPGPMDADGLWTIIAMGSGATGTKYGLALNEGDVVQLKSDPYVVGFNRAWSSKYCDSGMEDDIKSPCTYAVVKRSEVLTRISYAVYGNNAAYAGLSHMLKKVASDGNVNPFTLTGVEPSSDWVGLGRGGLDDQLPENMFQVVAVGPNQKTFSEGQFVWLNDACQAQFEKGNAAANCWRSKFEGNWYLISDDSNIIGWYDFTGMGTNRAMMYSSRVLQPGAMFTEG